MLRMSEQWHEVATTKKKKRKRKPKPDDHGVVSHPPPRTEEIARRKLLSPQLPRYPWSQEALFSFALDSVAGPPGLRPQHIKGGLLPGYRDEVMRSLHTVVQIMTEGNIPGAVAPSIASASLAALEKKDGDHWPVAAGETLRRLPSKALVATVSEDMTRYNRL